MREAVFSSPVFGITLSLAAYCIGVKICRRTSLAICNPLLISYLIIIPTLLLAGIPLEWYENGGDLIDMFLSPATAVLALTIYRQRELVRRHLLAIAAGTLAGCITSITTVYAMCRLLSLDEIVTASLLPKSITTPMAIAVSQSLGGIGSLTVLAVIFTGILGSILAPLLTKVFRIRDEVVQGIAIGASSHAVGTGKAIEMGEIQGAMSSISLVTSGILTVLVSIPFS